MNEVKTNQPVTADEIATTAKTLAKFEPGFLPLPLFLEIARLVVYSIIEIVPVRYNQHGELEVLLLEREQDDNLWPGMWHNPGCVVRGTDLPEGDEAAFRRIAEDELGLDADALQPTYVSHLVHRTRRGTESAKIFFAEFAGEPAHGTFFPLDQLPDNTIESHIPIIKTAALHFQSLKEELE